VSPAVAQEVPYRERSRGRRLTLLVLLGWLSALGPLATDAYLPALPSMSDSLGGSASATQVTLTCSLLGIAAGQLLWGPLSDVFGRRRPLLVALGMYVAMSLLCALAPSIWPLYAFVLLQCFGGAGGIVIARAVVRDLFSGVELARFFALMMLVMGAAPVLGPVLGAQILALTSWRGVFVALGLLGAALTISVAVALPETLPPARRHHGVGRETIAVFAGLLRDRSFARYLLVMGLGFAGFGAYLAGSSFVLQDVYGVSAQRYSLIFALNAIGLIGTAQIGRALVRRVGSLMLLRVGLVLGATGGGAVLAVVLLHGALVWLVLSVIVFSAGQAGLTMPNTTALALEEHPRVAGSAAALLGTTQFVAGAAAAPFVGLAGKHSAVPMGVLIASFATLNLVQFAIVSRRAAHALRS
jgi:MFS transporter, DHA1 family, multidrug resistance protein